MPTLKRYGPNTHWTMGEIKILSTMSNGHTSMDIARALGRSVMSVQSKASRMSIQLNCEMTNTTFGRISERHARSILTGSVSMTKDDYHFPYDLKWEGKRVNVKASVLQYIRTAKYWYWRFTVKETWKNCDLFMFLAYMPEKLAPVRAWLVPSSLCHKRMVSMGEKYAKGMYLNYEIEVKNLC